MALTPASPLGALQASPSQDVYDPSQYSNLREYVEAVQGSPLNYDNPQQQDIVNAAVSAMYGGGTSDALKSFFAPAPAPASSTSPLQTAATFTQNNTGLTPDIANEMMWRSMTTGVPTADFEKYGGYDAVRDLYVASGGGYDPNEIPVSMRQTLADQVAQQGSGNYGIFDWFGITPTQTTSSVADETGFRQPAPGSPLGALQVPLPKVPTMAEAFSSAPQTYKQTGYDYDSGTQFDQTMTIGQKPTSSNVIVSGSPNTFAGVQYYTAYDPATGATYNITPEQKVAIETDPKRGYFLGYGGGEDSPAGGYFIDKSQIKTGYTRPTEVQQSDAFTTKPGLGENVNDFSHGQLGNIYDSINSGKYVVSPDKSSIILQNGAVYGLRDLGQGFYDIGIGAKSGSYNVAIAVNDKNQAFFNKDFIDKGAIRYKGGDPGWAFSSLAKELSPIAPLLTLASIAYPELAPLAAAANTVVAVENNNPLGALASLTGIPGVAEMAPAQAVTAIRTANTVNNFAKAAETGNTLGMLSSGATLTGMGTTKINDAGLTVSDTLRAANLAKAIESGNQYAIANAAAAFAGSKTVKDAAKTMMTSDAKVSGLDDVQNAIYQVARSTGMNEQEAYDLSKSAAPPSGIQLAQGPSDTVSDAGSGLYKMDVSGTPTFAETPGAEKVKAPFGYTLLSETQVDNKPKGSYYDVTQNAWFTPTDDPETLISQLREKYGDTSGGGASFPGSTAHEGIPSPGQPSGGSDLGQEPVGPGEISDISSGPGATRGTSSGGPSNVPGALSSTPSAPSATQGTLPEVRVTAEPIVDDTLPEVVVRDTPIIEDTLPEVVVRGEPDDPYYPETEPPEAPFWPETEPPPIGGDKTPTSKTPSTPSIPSTPTTTPRQVVQPTGMTGASQQPSTTGALPGFLPAANLYTGSSTDLKIMQDLKQLFPGLGTADMQRLAAMLSSSQAGAQQKAPTPQQPMPQQAPQRQAPLSGLLDMITGKKSDSLFSALSSAGLNIIGGGALPAFAEGGTVQKTAHTFITGKTGHYVKGHGDGQSDDIPAMLADGEYVFDADTVAALGNGSSDAGAALLDKMRENIRKHKRSAPPDKIPPKAKSPLEYLKG